MSTAFFSHTLKVHFTFCRLLHKPPFFFLAPNNKWTHLIILNTKGLFYTYKKYLYPFTADISFHCLHTAFLSLYFPHTFRQYGMICDALSKVINHSIYSLLFCCTTSLVFCINGCVSVLQIKIYFFLKRALPVVEV